MSVIDELRKQIDQVDDEMLKLLEKRAHLVKGVGLEKKKTSQAPSGVPFYDPVREAKIISRLEESSPGEFPKSSIHHVFREVISACRSLEARFRVAYLGPTGTFSQIAAREIFGGSIEEVSTKSITEVFKKVEAGEADYGVVPLVNSISGEIAESQRALEKTSLVIRRDHPLVISHCLVSRAKDLTSIEEVFSHSQALAQCKTWLSAHLPSARVTEVQSTAHAAELAARTERSAAVASRLAAELLGLEVIAEYIQDRKDNTTRFAVLSQPPGAKLS